MFLCFAFSGIGADGANLFSSVQLMSVLSELLERGLLEWKGGRRREEREEICFSPPWHRHGDELDGWAHLLPNGHLQLSLIIPGLTILGQRSWLCCEQFEKKKHEPWNSVQPSREERDL